MVKTVKSYVKLQVGAGTANPSPPIGPALGQQGINIPEFCKSFNNKTAKIEKGMPIPVIITVYEDRSFTFVIKSPPASALLKKLAGIQSGSSNPNKEKVGQVFYEDVEKIAQEKAQDMTGSNVQAMTKTIMGTALSMGIVVKNRGENNE